MIDSSLSLVSMVIGIRSYDQTLFLRSSSMNTSQTNFYHSSERHLILYCNRRLSLIVKSRLLHYSDIDLFSCLYGKNIFRHIMMMIETHTTASVFDHHLVTFKVATNGIAIIAHDLRSSGYLIENRLRTFKPRYEGAIRPKHQSHTMVCGIRVIMDHDDHTITLTDHQSAIEVGIVLYSLLYSKASLNTFENTVKALNMNAELPFKLNHHSITMTCHHDIDMRELRSLVRTASLVNNYQLRVHRDAGLYPFDGLMQSGDVVVFGR